MKNLEAVIPLAEGFEEMEVVITADILRRAGVELQLAGLGMVGPIPGSRGIRIAPDVQWEHCTDHPITMLVLPGGDLGVRNLGRSESLKKLLQRRHAENQCIAAICAAPGLLASLGILQGRRVTSFPGILDPSSLDYHYLELPVVQDGHLVTSRGPGTAMDFALALVEILRGAEARQKTGAALQRPH